MRRREIIAGLAAVAAATVRPGGPSAQSSRRPALIGWIGTISSGRAAELKRKFVEGLRELGYEADRDFVVEDRHADGVVTRLPELAADLVARKPDVIVAGSTLATVAAKGATAEVPIVSATLSDPLDLGLVKSYARPGSNVTGILSNVEELAGKQLSLAVELMGGKPKVGVVVARRGSGAMQLRGVETAAAVLATELSVAEIDGPAQIDAAFESLKQAGAGVACVLGDPVFVNEGARIAASGLKAGLPTVYTLREHVEAGGLMSYGVNLGESFRRASVLVDKILKGEKPADLPVELPTKFELVINLRTANALRLTIPPALLARADEVIE